MKGDRPAYITALAGFGITASICGVIALGFGAAVPAVLRAGMKPDVAVSSIMTYYAICVPILAITSWYMFDGKVWTRWAFALVAVANAVWLHNVAYGLGVRYFGIGWALLVLALMILPDSQAFFVGVKRRYVNERDLRRPAVGASHGGARR